MMTLGWFMKWLGLAGISPGAGGSTPTRSHIPVSKASTFAGVVDAPGEFALDIALPHAYPSCYLYFDENTLWVTLDVDEITIIDGNTADFYYCVMNSATEGTAYNNKYTPAVGVVPSIPASPTAFADDLVGGAGVTGDVIFYKTAIPAISRGVIEFHGVVRRSLATMIIKLAGTELVNTTEVADEQPLSGLHVYVLGSAIQTSVAQAWGTLTTTEVSTAAATEMQLVVNFGLADDVATVPYYSVNVDPR
jgi:hypothetical protein